MKLNCVIVDDEPLAVTLLEQFINQVSFLRLQHKCYNAIEVLEFLKKEKADLIFMDINMPYLSGLELTNLLPKDQKFVFTTAYSDYAVESYEKNAVDYLVKPITFERFLKAVMRASELVRGNAAAAPEVNRDDQYIFVKTGKDIIKTEYARIVYIEGLKDYIILHTQEDRHIVYHRLKNLADTLPENFQRVHKSFIVNLNHIRRISDNHIEIGSVRIPISEQFRKGFQQVIGRKMI